MTDGTEISSLEALRSLFSSPPRDFSPTPLWWWSAEKVTSVEIRRQLENLRDGGVYNVVVINLAPSGPLFGAVVDDPIWFSDEWFERFDDACSHAEELGMRVWFYDQIGFSGANIQGKLTQQHPWAAGKSLALHEVTAGANSAIPDTIGPDRIVGAYGMPSVEHPHGRRLTVTDGRFDSLVEGESARVVTWRPTAFDYLNADAVELLIDFVHLEFERRMPQRLGKVIAGSFQDELPATNSWTGTFPESFAKTYGYDIVDVLPALFAPEGVGGAKILHDYFEHRTALTEKALFEPLGEWHERHNMLLGADQFNPARAGWPTQATQLYTDYFRTHRHYSAAGSDHEGDSKVHSSMAHLYGHDRVWLESFHSSGWGGTLQDTYDWLLPFLRSGATLYNPHAVYFGMAGGWFEWAPPSTDWRQPYWGQHKAFADCVARIMSLMSWGTHSCSVAVLYPSATSKSSLPLGTRVDHFSHGTVGIAAADEAQEVYLELAGSNNWWKTKSGALTEDAIDFDIVDDASVQRAAIDSGALLVRDERYTVVLLPAVQFMESATAAALCELLDQGGRVIVVGSVAHAAAGTAGDDGEVVRLMAHPALEQFSNAAEAVTALGKGYRALDCDLASLARTDHSGTSIAFVPSNLPNASAHPLRTGNDWFWDDFDFDPARYQQSQEVRLPLTTAWAEAWNPATGEQLVLQLTPRADCLTAELAFDGAPGLLLLWGTEADQPAGSTVRDSRALSTRDVSDRWTGQVITTLDNAFGEFDRPATSGPMASQIWKVDVGESLDDATPTEWHSTRATFGTKGSWAEPSTNSHSFAPWAFSATRGIEKDFTHRGLLGVKGRVPDAFVVGRAAGPGETSRYRTFVSLPEAGSYDLFVGATAAKRVWVDGTLVLDDFADPNGSYLVRIPVMVQQNIVGLEYELGDSQGAGTFLSPAKAEHQGSFYSFTRAGDWPDYPVYMTPLERTASSPERLITFSREIEVAAGVSSARIVVGATSSLAVHVDGEVVGRQEMAEYYESDWGATPQFYVHELTHQLSEGIHTIELRCDTASPEMVLFVDLVVEYPSGPTAYVSGFGWNVAIGSQASTTSVPTRKGWGESANAQVVRRPHPLVGAQWLSGNPQIGSDAVEANATESLEERRQWLRMTLPAGVRALEIPTTLQFTAEVDGLPLELVPSVAGYRSTLPAPTNKPVELMLTSAPTAFRRGGAALDGPVEIELVPAPISLGAWKEIGLDWLSGGVKYSRALLLTATPTTATLDLGRVRGHVRIAVNGMPVADLFCTPWSQEIGAYLREGENSIEIEVYNTLGPYLDDVSPTRWVFPSQKVDGLFGPVTLTLDTNSEIVDD